MTTPPFSSRVNRGASVTLPMNRWGIPARWGETASASTSMVADSRTGLPVASVAQGLKLVAEKGKAGEAYNLCSGKPRQIAEVLRTLLSFSQATIKIEPDPALLRSNDVPRCVGDNRKIKALGLPEVSDQEFDGSLRETLDWYRTGRS